MNILRKIFHRHEIEEVSCPYTMKTYSLCNYCGKKFGWRHTDG
jgi:hypothetical protein